MSNQPKRPPFGVPGAGRALVLLDHGRQQQLRPVRAPAAAHALAETAAIGVPLMREGRGAARPATPSRHLGHLRLRHAAITSRAGFSDRPRPRPPGRRPARRCVCGRCATASRAQRAPARRPGSEVMAGPSIPKRRQRSCAARRAGPPAGSSGLRSSRAPTSSSPTSQPAAFGRRTSLAARAAAGSDRPSGSRGGPSRALPPRLPPRRDRPVRGRALGGRRASPRCPARPGSWPPRGRGPRPLTLSTGDGESAHQRDHRVPALGRLGPDRRQVEPRPRGTPARWPRPSTSAPNQPARALGPREGRLRRPAWPAAMRDRRPPARTRPRARTPSKSPRSAVSDIEEDRFTFPLQPDVEHGSRRPVRSADERGRLAVGSTIDRRARGPRCSQPPHRRSRSG